MAIFKAGDSVRVVGRKPGTIDFDEVPIGSEGVIIEALGIHWEWLVHVPGHHHAIGPGQFPADCWGFNSEHLAPVLDAQADAFMGRIHKMDREAERATFITTEEGTFERCASGMRKFS